METYKTIGSVRGSCGHNHRTLKGAADCLRKDRNACRAQGGYSDRWVRKYVDGRLVELPETESLEVQARLTGDL